MRPCKKAFLFAVGVLAIAFDKVNKAIGEAVEAVDKQKKQARSETTK